MADTNDLFAIGCAERAATRTAAALHRDFNRGASTLRLIARVAPLLGALGTTIGTIEAITLYHVSSFDYGDVAGGPADAFVLFALSLPVAIFAWGGFHYLRHQVETFDFEMRAATLDLLNNLARRRSGHTARTPPC